MKWGIYLKYKEKSHRILEIREGVNSDIYISPLNSLYFSREVLKNLNAGDKIEVRYDNLGKDLIDHFSAHASGQRHIKLSPELLATEVIAGSSLKNIAEAVPLITMVASANLRSQKEPSGRWFGYCLPDDVDYLIMDMVAIPKNSELGVNRCFSIKNEKKSIELFDEKTLDMKNCKIKIFTHATDHKPSLIPSNIIFQQNRGKTLAITRVENGRILAEVSILEVIKTAA